jgi:ribosome-binding factor A
MSSRRIAKVAEALRETVSTTVLFELKDPRVRNVTVLRTEVSPDLRSARVFVSVMGDERAQSLAMHGLRSARGFIQSRIADRLELRYTPILQFVLDAGVKLSVQASSIIREALSHPAVEPAQLDAEESSLREFRREDRTTGSSQTADTPHERAAHAGADSDEDREHEFDLTGL